MAKSSTLVVQANSGVGFVKTSILREQFTLNVGRKNDALSRRLGVSIGVEGGHGLSRLGLSGIPSPPDGISLANSFQGVFGLVGLYGP